MFRNIYKLSLLITLFTISLTGSNLKLLILIIDSDDLECYKECRKVWRAYMHSYPNNIKSYFIRGNPDMEKDFEFVDDTIWTKTEESLQPGILNKTILSLDAFGNELDKFDYILRTNLSSFYVFDGLLKYLEDKPRLNFVSGSIVYYYNFLIPSGCGYIISKDLAKIMTKNKLLFINKSENPDDIISGYFLTQNKVNFFVHNRFEIWSIQNWEFYKKNSILDMFFQFRVKNYNSSLRLHDDTIILNELLNKFYLNKI